MGDFYTQHHGVRFVALRFSSVYGPGQGKGINEAVKNGLLGKACRPYPTRLPDDLIFAKDVARAVSLTCFHDGLISPRLGVALYEGRPQAGQGAPTCRGFL